MDKPRILHLPTGDSRNVQRLGPYGLETLIPESDELQMTAYRVTIEPHSTTAVSHHRIAEELYYVLAGQGTALLDGVAHTLMAGDFLRLPPGVKHGFVTQSEPLVMLDIHSPGSRPDRDVYFDGAPPSGFADNE
ncbi:cupin domain-containing protein [Cerasicoccus maritimus]|uniref:cupin domain-containing protein n=1 Tax=Cerasicoccus maritimus TaxID=490089 RepID=UPI002852D0E1|nr:cupin domain-containing protein [Cerasicoccus maritimus]